VRARGSYPSSAPTPSVEARQDSRVTGVPVGTPTLESRVERMGVPHTILRLLETQIPGRFKPSLQRPSRPLTHDASVLSFADDHRTIRGVCRWQGTSCLLTRGHRGTPVPLLPSGRGVLLRVLRWSPYGHTATAPTRAVHASSARPCATLSSAPAGIEGGREEGWCRGREGASVTLRVQQILKSTLTAGRLVTICGSRTRGTRKHPEL
jgi:hypothetical protein